LAVPALLEKRGLHRLRLSARASGFLGGLALLLGVVLIVDAAITLLWEDPLTAVFTQQEQKALSKKLAANEAAALPPSTLELVRKAGSVNQRMAVLAAHERETTKAGEPLGRIAIPRIGVNFVFVAGTGERSLKKGPGSYTDNVLPGEKGTVAIAGHRTTYLAPFRKLNKLRRGDTISLTMGYGIFKYSVEGSKVVSPGNTGVLRHIRHDRIVLTTCTPLFSAAKRLVITGRRIRSEPRGPAIQLVPAPLVAPLPAGGSGAFLPTKAPSAH
jgi:sortase A